MKITGGLADGKKPEDFDAQELLTGTQVEMEHTSDPKIAQRIAMDHLTEDSEYYKKLAKIETAKSINWAPFNPDREKAHPIVDKIDFQGLPISIEQKKGDIREWYDPYEKRSGKTKMHYPYGYIRGTEGADGEQVDVYVGPEKDSKKVFIVHQVKGGPGRFKKYDEDKVMLGFTSLREAKAAFLMHYSDPKYLGSTTQTDIESFKRMFLKKSLISGIEPMVGQTGDVPPTESFAPPMQVGMGTTMMGPPPIDPETFEGVNSLLGRVGNAKDAELMQIAGEIWGDYCDFNGQSPEQARNEIIGFLLDQRDLLGVEPEPQSFEPSPSLPTMAASGSSDYFNVSRASPVTEVVQQPGGSFYDAGSANMSSMDSFVQDFLRKPESTV